MTSPPFFVLYAAFVCYIVGTVQGNVADNVSNLTYYQNNISAIMNIRTNTSKILTDNIDDKAIMKGFVINNKREYVNVNNVLNDNVENTVKVVDNVFNPVSFVNIIEYYKKEKGINDKNSLAFNEFKYHGRMRQYENRYLRKRDSYRNDTKVRVRRDDDSNCEGFTWTGFSVNKKILTSPKSKNSSDYARDANCIAIINANEGSRVKLTFINEFHIEEHPTCKYDYIEIRDGPYGYSPLQGKFCGNTFPPVIESTGPYLWLKFHSDNTIEYSGFQIQVDSEEDPRSHAIPESCTQELKDKPYGIVDSTMIDEDCKDFFKENEVYGQDVVWHIVTEPGTKIFLNFTSYILAQPNECELNFIQVFGRELEEETQLDKFCGSVPNSVNSKDNEMYIRLYTTKPPVRPGLKELKTSFNTTYTAYRQVDPNKEEGCLDGEFDCEDNTCMVWAVRCNGYANCRLKTDEDPDMCATAAESKIKEPHILVILIIFTLILSGMSFVFLFKCIRKLYQDHKLIKEHIRQSCEDRLDDLLTDSRLPLDVKKLQRDSEPRESLERENHTNEMFKQQRSFSHRKQTSIDSDFPIQETHLDIEEEPWQRDAERHLEPQDIKIERNGRLRRSDTSKKEESIRSKKESEEKERKEIRDVSVGAPDTKESGCQTRESLFQAETAPSSDGSNGTNSRGFSTFGYSGATIARKSPPAPPSQTSQITLELLRLVPQQDPVKTQKKLSDRRPMSAETTRSAPDVIIVSKPIR